MRVEAKPRIRKLRHIGEADNDGTGLAKTAHGLTILCRRRGIPQDPRAGRSRISRDVEEILYGEGHARERRKGQASLQEASTRFGLSPGAIAHDPPECAGALTRRIVDALQGGFQQINTVYGAALESGGNGANRVYGDNPVPCAPVSLTSFSISKAMLD